VKSSEPTGDLKGMIPNICVRSFFNGVFTRRHKAHRAWTMAAVTLFMSLTLLVVLLNSQAGFAVYYNGEEIGSAKSIEDVSTIVTSAEERLTEIFGYQYSLDNSISVTANLGAKADGTEHIEKAILGVVDGVAELYVLEINGVAVGASDDEKVLDAILNGILNEYTTEQTASVRFKDTVSVSYRFINDDITQDPNEIKTLLNPRNEASAYKLNIENIEKKQFTEEVAFDVSYYDDDTIYEGDSVVMKEGAPGENLITESIIYINGQEQSRNIVDKVMTKQPVTEVVANGTAPRPLTASYGEYIWPTEGIITSNFGYRTGFGSSNHQGIDIAGDYGQNIVAADGGEVILADWYYGYGNLVQIKHDNGDVSYYGHCSSMLVTEGERVYQGQEIALMGATGVASGVHLHFEVRQNGEPVDPLTVLP
jgi:murein DD-endopeptidase MepM/ murein hydrolase activator NlpD